MRLIEEMEQRLRSEDSTFRAQLLREDIDRLRRLESLARRHQTLDAFAKEGLAIGWTRGNLRTHEVEEPRRAWDAFDRLRLAKLVGCNWRPALRPAAHSLRATDRTTSGGGPGRMTAEDGPDLTRNRAAECQYLLS